MPIESDAANIAAWVGYRDFKVVRKEIEDRSGSICSFYLTPADGGSIPSFKAGQFLTFQLGSAWLEDITQQLIRCYSLSDAPRNDYYRVSIKRVPLTGETTLTCVALCFSGENASDSNSSNCKTVRSLVCWRRISGLGYKFLNISII